MTYAFSDYFRPDEVEVPDQFTCWRYHASNDWAALESFELDSVVAGATNETRVKVTEAGHDFHTTAAEVERNTTEVGVGEDENIQERMLRVARYRQEFGLSDGYALRHRIGAYVEVDGVRDVKAAVAMFGPVGVGINMPDSALEAFVRRNPWDVERGAKKVEQRYVSVVGWDGAWLEVVAFGRRVSMSERFFKKYAVLALAYLPEDMLIRGRTIPGFDLDKLQVRLRDSPT